MTIKTGFDYYPEADRKIKPMSKAEYSQEEMYQKLMEQYKLALARNEAMEKALRTIMNMGFESCREEHRIARKALQETGHE